MLGELADDAVLEGADGDAVHPAFQVLGVVLDALTLADALLGVVVVHRVGAHLGRADLEGDAGSERGLLEQHDDRATRERAQVGGEVVLHRAGGREDGAGLRGGELADRDQVAA